MGLTSDVGITLNDNLTFSNLATINADANSDGTGTFSVAAGKTVSTTNNTLNIIAADLNLPGLLNSGTENTTIVTANNGNIGLGSATGAMSMSGAELANITAANLTIGGSTGGNITVNGVVAANFSNISGLVTLDATANTKSITFSGGPSTFKTLTAKGDQGIAVNTNLTTSVGNLMLDGDSDNAADTGDSIAVASGVTLSSAGNMVLDSSTGGISLAGIAIFRAANGITFNDNLTSAGVGTILIDADMDDSGAGNFTMASGATLSTNNNNLQITADDLDLSGSINSGTGSIDIMASVLY